MVGTQGSTAKGFRKHKEEATEAGEQRGEASGRLRGVAGTLSSWRLPAEGTGERVEETRACFVRVRVWLGSAVRRSVGGERLEPWRRQVVKGRSVLSIFLPFGSSGGVGGAEQRRAAKAMAGAHGREAGGEEGVLLFHFLVGSCLLMAHCPPSSFFREKQRLL